jgi:hypothetical protein
MGFEHAVMIGYHPCAAQRRLPATVTECAIGNPEPILPVWPIMIAANAVIDVSRMKSRQAARRFLIAFFSVTLAAVVFRLDYWPLTWVPMYAAYEPVEDIRVQVWDTAEVRRGFLLTRQDGRTEYVNYRQLNIPRTKFIRLYYERIYGVVPAKETFDHFALSPMNRRLRELAGTYPARAALWDWRILYALNKSLHREPGQPDFIVRAEAASLERLYNIRDLNDGGGVTPKERRSIGTAAWKAEWLDRWKNDDI